MLFAKIGWLLALGLFPAMLIVFECGRRWGIKNSAKNAAWGKPNVSVMEGATYGLFSLLVAFTFYGAAARFDSRRELIATEANEIGTTYLRLDLLPTTAQPALRDAFRSYLDSRIEVYRKLPDLDSALFELARSEVIQREIWSESVAATRDIPPPLQALYLNSLNQMIDITTTRTAAAKMHPPTIIYMMLFALALIVALLAGYNMSEGRRSAIHIIVFAAVTTFAIFVIVDMEFPRKGLIRINDFDQVLINLRQKMN
jgi:hypothetical protein